MDDSELNKQLNDILNSNCDPIQDEVVLSSDILKQVLNDCGDSPDGLLISDLKNPVDDSVFSNQENIQNKSEDDLQKSMDKLDSCLKSIDTKISNHTVNINGSVEIDHIIFKLIELKDLYDPVFQYHFELKNQIDVLIQKRQDYLDTINPIREEIIDLNNKITAKTDQKNKYASSIGAIKTQIDQYQSEIDALNLQKTTDQTNLDTLVNRQITEINSDTILSADFTSQDSSQTRKDILEQYIVNLLSTTSINNLTAAYANNLTINSNNVKVTKNLTFEIDFDNIKYSIDLSNNVTKESLLTNTKLQKRTFLISTGPLTIKQPIATFKYSGALYTQYYNQFIDPINNFFTLEERGLTSDPSKIDTQLQADIINAKSSGIDVSNSVKIDIHGNSYYIKDFQKYQDFNITVQGKIDNRTKEIKTSRVTPVFNNLITALTDLANKQAKYIITYGELFTSTLTNKDNIVDASQVDITLNINDDLTSVIDTVNKTINSFKIAHTDLINEIQRLQSIKQDYSAKMQAFQADLTSVPCAKQMDANVTEEPGAGIDPLGKQSLNGTDITKPNPGKWCYWLKFAKIATLAALAPIPDGASFRYWPYGLVIPTPGGTKKIPLPPVFIPITIISSKMGTIVIFIAQCGVLPCPLVFYISNTGVKKYLSTLRGPSDKFGQPENTPSVKNTIQLKYDAFKSLSADKLSKIGFDKPSTDLLDKADTVPTFSEFKIELFSELEKKIDSVEVPKMSRFNQLKNNLGKDINKLSSTDKINIIKQDFSEYLDSIDLPTFELPKDKTKINPRKESSKGMNDLFKDFNTNKNTDDSKNKINLKIKILNEIDNINVNDVQPSFTSIPIDDNNIQKIKNSWSNILVKSFDKLKTNPELAFTSLSITKLDSINISVPFICKTDPVVIPTAIPGEAITSIIAFKIIIDDSLNLLTPTKIKQLLDLNVLSFSKIKDSLKTIIDRTIPTQYLPSSLYNFKIQNTIQSSLSNMNKISGKSFKLGVPQQELKINMNKLKEPFKSSFNNSISVASKSFPLNINSSFDTFTNVDMKILLKKSLKNSIDSAASIFEGPYKAVNSLSSIKKINLMDVTTGLLKNPLSGPENGIKDKITITDIEALKTAFKLLDTTIVLPFIGALFMAGTGSGDVLRQIHPVLDYDDTPPWERLSLNNFIFMLFLDDFLHVNKQKNGF